MAEIMSSWKCFASKVCQLGAKLRPKAQGRCPKQTALVEAEVCMALTVRGPMFHWSLQPWSHALVSLGQP